MNWIIEYFSNRINEFSNQVKGINKHHKNSYKILKVNNFSSDSILNYISIYILTFIEFDLNSISNIVTLIFIIGLLGIISIRYDDLYINPTLLLWNYKVYNITIEKKWKSIRENRFSKWKYI